MISNIKQEATLALNTVLLCCDGLSKELYIITQQDAWNEDYSYDLSTGSVGRLQ